MYYWELFTKAKEPEKTAILCTEPLLTFHVRENLVPLSVMMNFLTWYLGVLCYFFVS